MKKVLLLLPLSCVLTGCSFFSAKTQELTVNTNPPDCKILINGEFYTAPVKMTIPTTSNFTVTAMKDGYSSRTSNLNYGLSKTGMLDAIGLACFLVPGVGLFSDGAYAINNSHLFIELEKTEPPQAE